jgi:PAS domain S-box-containing protein
MGTFDWDVPGNSITWSRWHEELWGFKPGEFGGTYEAFAERVHPEDLSRINAEVARCMAAREPFSSEFRVVWPDSTVHWVMGMGEFTFAEDGQPLRMHGVVLETTERKLMEERMVRERDFSEAMINSLPGIFYLYDDTKKFLRWNKNFEHVSGYSADEIAGMSPLDFFIGDERRLIEGKIQEVFVKGESNAEANFVSKDGRRTTYYFTGLRIKIDNKPCLIGMGIDITDRKRAEEALERAYGELEQRVEERTRELMEANIKLKELDRLKAEFLATMSHELRTPLNSIIGFTGMILQGMAGEINEEQKKQLSMVYNSAKHLLSLINDILDLSRIESGKVEVSMKGFKVDEVVFEVVRSLDPMVSQKGLRLITEVPDEIPEIWSDRKKFFQILLNLVNNAVKFTDRGEIKIACKTDNNNLEVSVSDTGIGIKKENMDLLFEAFRQVDGTSRRRYEGTGLGLYLCKKLLDLLGGRIWVESEYGKGSRFTFTLPLGPKVRE